MILHAQAVSGQPGDTQVLVGLSTSRSELRRLVLGLGSRQDLCRDDIAQARKGALQVLVSLGLQTSLRRAFAIRPIAAAALAVACIDLVNDLHALRDLGKRRKAHAVQVRVVGQVDEDLH